MFRGPRPTTMLLRRLSRRPVVGAIAFSPSPSLRRSYSRPKPGHKNKQDQQINKALDRSAGDSRGVRANAVPEGREEIEMQVPGTFVALPLSQAWRQARTTQEFLGYQWERLLTKLVDLGGILAIKYLSMPSLTSLPRFKVQRSSIAPTATALHRRMSEAVAAGDGAALRQICVPALYNQLTAAIRRRTPDERVEWELVEYVRPLSFPRIASNRCINLSSDEYYQQAVVGIAATQRLARYARATGEVVAGSTRLRTAVEYLVISRKINAKTWEPTPWRIWGTREETTSESWANEKRYLSTMKAKAAAR